ncbi:hypothetical protein [uncultured Phascolarctobacterium sp.]|uniref:hypothetical protein n=1 Tax=uncultured Phascolarctobacterium sp. TaxID=512296 RepID=UPI002612076A|nr:hypothetical protein [uncultured Phascolarctobacterium sp.]
MLTQIKNVKFYMQARLGQRGAEMVEYAIVLACIAAIGVAYYKMYYTPGTDVDTFNYTLDRRFLNIKGIASGL